MERRVSVNAEATSDDGTVTPDGLPKGWSETVWTGKEASAEPSEPLSTEDGPVERKPSGQGPCLYLGPAGQRCDRAALAGGFCASHRPGARREAFRNPARILAAALGIAALVWPYVNDLVREIIRWTHSR